MEKAAKAAMIPLAIGFGTTAAAFATNGQWLPAIASILVGAGCAYIRDHLNGEKKK